MLATALVSIIAVALMMGMMALGVIVSGKRLRGSCGGNPDSGKCGCSPEKKAACRVEHAHMTRGDEHDEDEVNDVFAGRPLTPDTLAPPGEHRLVQLRTGRQ